jgi:hypothetical protein
MAVASAVCHSRRLAICSIPAFKNPFENPGFDAGVGEGVEAGVAAVVGEVEAAGLSGTLNAIGLPPELSEPFIALASASRSTKERLQNPIVLSLFGCISYLRLSKPKVALPQRRNRAFT